MRRTRPLVALFANLFLVHAMWIGTGFACAPTDMSQSGAGAMAAMDMPAATTSGMDMPDMPSGASETQSKTPAHQHVPCRFPWAPDGCQAAAPCLPLAIGSPEQVLHVANDAPTAIATLRVLTPPSRGHPPEPPPPRA